VRHRIHLLRHAKSSWEDTDLRDHDRPLAPRGHRAAERLRGHVEAAGLAPQLVLCSSATRALETWEGIRDGLPPETRLEVSGDLYAADAGSLLLRLNGLPETVDSVLMIGHNPGMEELAIGLSGGGDDDALARLKTKYPTAGLASLSVDGAWSELAWQGATLDDFVVPRDL
jgi:phosphohistidine phosphatase